MSKTYRTKKTIVPVWVYIIASIFLFVAFMTIAQEVIWAIAGLEAVALDLSWSGGLITEHMVVSIFMVVVIIGGFWIIDLLFTGKRRR